MPNLEVKARFLVAGFLAGLHKTPFRGSSVEFKEYRDYQPGDELKLIDWKAYARTDRLHVKLREEETNMTVNLLVDKSCSMDYKSRTASMTKWDYSRALVAAFLLFLHKQRDAASLGFVGRTLEELTRGGARASHYRRMMALLHRDADDSESHLANSLNSLLPAVEMRSMILVFSDFYEDPKALKAPLSHLRHLKCEVLLFHILDPMEISFDFDEPLLLQELESEDKMRLSPDLVRDDYNESIRRHIDDISSLCVARDCEYLLLDTTVSPIHALGKYISKRRFMQ
ncbi:MAG: DUF58 domain-containing protein [Kiritimatiellaeota bacterium]|nr:DUF58 domain-containing protein [Kiritimatiellota bacterium]